MKKFFTKVIGNIYKSNYSDNLKCPNHSYNSFLPKCVDCSKIKYDNYLKTFYPKKYTDDTTHCLPPEKLTDNLIKLKELLEKLDSDSDFNDSILELIYEIEEIVSKDPMNYCMSQLTRISEFINLKIIGKKALLRTINRCFDRIQFLNTPKSPRTFHRWRSLLD